MVNPYTYTHTHIHINIHTYIPITIYENSLLIKIFDAFDDFDVLGDSFEKL